MGSLRMSSFISVPRAIFEDESLFCHEKFSRREAFLDLVQKASYERKTIPIRGGNITIERGQLFVTVRRLATRWGWSVGKVQDVLREFEAVKLIERKSDSVSNTISIVDYDVYSKPSNANEYENRYENQHENRHNTNKEKKEKEGNKEIDSSALKDAVERIYGLYPTKCPISGRATGKSSKDKQRIESLLKKGLTEEMLSETIKRYIEESKTSVSYIKNFSTFLNNIPDYSQQKTKDASGDDPAPAKLTKEEDIWRAANPTKEEIKKWFEENFYPFHLKNEGETDEEYWARIRPDYDAAKKRWIDNRVLYRKQKY